MRRAGALALVAGLAASCRPSTHSETTVTATATATTGYCARYSDYVTQCGRKDDCSRAMVDDCSTFAAGLSPAYLAAASACMTRPFACEQGGSPAHAQCMSDRMATATPTYAQNKVRDGFCKICPDGSAASSPTACSGFFQPAGAGLAVLAASDQIAATIEDRCVSPDTRPRSLDCLQSFLTCAGEVLADNAPAACRQARGARH